jgi:site-specific recombinase XerD
MPGHDPNVRLTAIRSFARYASLRAPASLPILQRILAIPAKRCDRPVLGYLSREEMQAILDSPDSTTWSGRRDIVLFNTLYNTGARVSEVVACRVADVVLDRQAALLLHGKGRKERLAPL